MSEHQSIEERLAGAWFTAQTDSAETLIRYVADYLADADLPLVDLERGIAVIRLDKKLARRLLDRCSRKYPPPPCDDPKCAPCTAARIIGGEQGDGE